jgi:hypothetical protein
VRSIEAVVRPKFLPFELAILEAVGQVLPAALAGQLARQVAAVNKVQRLLEWHEIELYCMRWFKVRWPEAVLFPRKDEHSLAQVECLFGSTLVPITVWAVAGHVFSLESPIGLKTLVSQRAKFEIRNTKAVPHES